MNNLKVLCYFVLLCCATSAQAQSSTDDAGLWNMLHAMRSPFSNWPSFSFGPFGGPQGVGFSFGNPTPVSLRSFNNAFSEMELMSDTFDRLFGMNAVASGVPAAAGEDVTVIICDHDGPQDATIRETVRFAEPVEVAWAITRDEPPPPPAAAPKPACEADAKALCPTALKKDPRAALLDRHKAAATFSLAMCLQDHKHELASAACRAAVTAQDTVYGACGDDIRASGCARVAPGGNRVHECLLAHLVRGDVPLAATCGAYLRAVAPGVDAAAATARAQEAQEAAAAAVGGAQAGPGRSSERDLGRLASARNARRARAYRLGIVVLGAAAAAAAVLLVLARARRQDQRRRARAQGRAAVEPPSSDDDEAFHYKLMME